MYFNRAVALLGSSCCSQVAWGKDSPSTPDYVEGELSTACDAAYNACADACLRTDPDYPALQENCADNCSVIWKRCRRSVARKLKNKGVTGVPTNKGGVPAVIEP